MEKINQIGIVICVMVIGACIASLPCLLVSFLESDNQPTIIQPVVIVPYPEPLQPATNITIYANVPLPEPFIISSITPCSEPYYINTTDSVLEVGEWVHSTAEYKRLLKNQFYGPIIKVDGDLLTVCVGGDTEIINKYWVEPWDCEMIVYIPNSGYYCNTGCN